MIPKVNLGVGTRLKKFRKENKLTQKQLAEIIGVSSQVVSNWERDYTSPNSNDISNLSKALGYSADMILVGYDVEELAESIVVLSGPDIKLDEILKDNKRDVTFNNRVLSQEEKEKIFNLIKVFLK